MTIQARNTILAAVAALLFGCGSAVANPVDAPVATKASNAKTGSPSQVLRRMMLDKFFDELKAAKSQADGDRAMAKIWHMWMTSGRPAVDITLRQSHALMMRGALRVALSLANRAVDMAPKHPEAYNHRATVHYFRKDYAAAVKDIRETLKLEPRHFGAIAGLGFIYIRMEKWAGALKAFETATKVNPWLHNRVKVMKMLRLKVVGQAL